MDIEHKERLALTGDMGIKAAAIRLMAARLTTQYERQQDFAQAAGLSKTSYNNMEKGVQYPNRKVMEFLFKAHRVDFNFLMAGNFAQLPGDVQDLIFPALERAHSEWAKTRD